MRPLACTAAVIVLVACGEAPGEAAPKYWRYEDQFHYKVTPAFTTASGIAVDPTGQEVSPELVDRLADEVDRCLLEAFGDPPAIPADVRRDGQCYGDTFVFPYPRKFLTVKVPDDWTLSCDGSQQVLPAHAPDEGCLAKGLHPTPECPCRWRAGIQDQRTVVTTPSFYIFKDPLIRIVTGCNDPWHSPPLAKCATPSTDPLYH